MPDVKPVSVEGTVTLSNGKKVSFSLSREYSWQQWGETQETLYHSMPIVEAMQSAAYDEFQSEDRREAETLSGLFYAYPGDDEAPKPATHWAWQTGNQWVAVDASEHDTWWDDNDPAKPDAEADWWRPISDVPATGTLLYKDQAGNELDG